MTAAEQHLNVSSLPCSCQTTACAGFYFPSYPATTAATRKAPSPPPTSGSSIIEFLLSRPGPIPRLAPPQEVMSQGLRPPPPSPPASPLSERCAAPTNIAVERTAAVGAGLLPSTPPRGPAALRALRHGSARIQWKGSARIQWNDLPQVGGPGRLGLRRPQG